MNEVSRKEKKYLISSLETVTLSHRLESCMMPDAHNGPDGYRVRSLYFDSLHDRDFFEKEDGVELRRKIRLRLYDPAGDFAVLEMKQKQGDNQKKRSLRVSKPHAQQLAQGQYGVLLQYPEAFASECYGVMQMHCYRPKTIVEYRRKAYIAKENNIRVTFDTHLVSTEASTDIFNENLCMYPVMDFYNTVLEVKYNHFLLSYIKDSINACNKAELSVSKYIMARSVTRNVNIRL